LRRGILFLRVRLANDGTGIVTDLDADFGLEGYEARVGSVTLVERLN
jgi:hypothetical protein